MTAIAASSRCIPTSCSASAIEHFEEILDDHKDRNGYTLDTDLTAEDWEELVGRYKQRLEEEHGEPFPQDPFKQLWGAISAVFGSWMNQRAVTYRRLHNIPESWGTAVNVQAMVFGNMGETSATGVAFTRNPSTGEKTALRRIPDQCAGRGRGRRHPHAAGNHRSGAQGVGLRQAVDGSGDAGRVQGADPHLSRAGEALPRHAGPRIHGRAGQAVDAADPLRQAHRQGGAADCGRAGQRGPDQPQGGGDAGRSRRARSAPASDHRSERRAQGDRDRAAGLARRGGRRDRVLGRRCREHEIAGQEGDPGAGRDLARGHPRHARRRRHPHHPRRHDLACGGGRARHGQALRLGRGHAARRLRVPAR